MGNRRYKVGANPEYDRAFDRLAMGSLFLNPARVGDDVNQYNNFALMQTKKGLAQLLTEYRGDVENPKRAYVLGRREVPSKLAEVLTTIEQIKQKFVKLKQTKINAGHFPPEEMPDELKEELHRAEASEDIVKAEINRLETALENFPARAEADERMPCLKNGPVGTGRKKQGVLVVLDGQNIFPDDEGTLRIKDSRSPYHGMRCADYFQTIVKPYGQEMAKLMAEHQAECFEAKQDGNDPGAIPKKRPPMPSWPEEIKRYAWEKVA